MLQLKSSEELTLSQKGYRLLKKIGEGSYAQVYLGEFKSNLNDENPKPLACKLVDVSKAPKDFVSKFLPRELDILIRLNHPHIIHIHSIFQRKTKYFIFMRLAENGDLLEFILKKGPVPEAQCRVWVRQIGLAIQYLHEMDVAHRDLKCENCLITNNFNLKVADFGFSRFVVDARGKKTTSSTYCGSLSYAAPEVLRGVPYHPKISDLWSLGVIIYIMVNKAMPFDDTNVKKLHDNEMNRRWKFRAKVAGNLSDNLKTLVGKLLEPDVLKRWKIEQVVNSDWIGMDYRLVNLSPLEKQALEQAQEERKIYISSVLRKTTRTQERERFQSVDIKILKPNTQAAGKKYGSSSRSSIQHPEQEPNRGKLAVSNNSQDSAKKVIESTVTGKRSSQKNET